MAWMIKHINCVHSSELFDDTQSGTTVAMEEENSKTAVTVLLSSNAMPTIN